ncbi:MAG: 1,4-alpha-glucan branching protein [Sediminibacterium sp.]|nr:1,4-alpha-glucan branching protein [Sediminibacterium sp.]
MDKSFSTVDWAKGSNIYEVNIRQYTNEGTFSAFGKHLPRLKEMGVEILWLMPITPISEKVRQGTLGSYYACSSYVAVNPEFGELADFKKLVNDAHALGFKLIIDWVANHTGWDHHWTTEHPDWYLKDANGNFTEKNGWHDVIDLDFEKKEMRSGMIAAMKYWVTECNIDGFRCDMAHLVPLDFWKEARTECDTLKPLFWLAECETVSYHDVFDASYAWWWMHETNDVAKGISSLSRVREVLHSYTQYPQGAIKLFFTSNHDENSWNGTEYEKYGNAAKAWAVFTSTWQGMPLIYSGQESPNTKRLKFFDKDLIEWNDPLELHAFYQSLLQLKKNRAVAEGETFILPSEYDGELMAYLRKKDNDIVLVILNVSKLERLRINVVNSWLKGKFRNVFSGLEFSFSGDESFELQAEEYIVYEKVT